MVLLPIGITALYQAMTIAVRRGSSGALRYTSRYPCCCERMREALCFWRCASPFSQPLSQPGGWRRTPSALTPRISADTPLCIRPQAKFASSHPLWASRGQRAFDYLQANMEKALAVCFMSEVRVGNPETTRKPARKPRDWGTCARGIGLCGVCVCRSGGGCLQQRVPCLPPCGEISHRCDVAQACPPRCSAQPRGQRYRPHLPQSLFPIVSNHAAITPQSGDDGLLPHRAALHRRAAGPQSLRLLARAETTQRTRPPVKSPGVCFAGRCVLGVACRAPLLCACSVALCSGTPAASGWSAHSAEVETPLPAVRCVFLLSQEPLPPGAVRVQG